jgi:hypothetical protein
VQAVKRKQVRRITISIGDVIAASLIVGNCDVCGRAIMTHRIRVAESISA